MRTAAPLADPLRVAAFTGGASVASARFRVRQLIPALREQGIEMQEHIAALGAYPPRARVLRPLWAAATLASRLPSIAASYRADVTFLQREMLSTYRTLEPLTHAPRVLDLDDAVWLHREASIRKLVAGVEGVVCGNAFTDAWVAQWQPNRIVIPTAVDTVRWRPRPPSGARRIIGWTGQSSGGRYVAEIGRALARVLELHPDVILRIVSDRPVAVPHVPSDRIEYVPWSPEVEVPTVQDLTVGIMPLQDTVWEQGKCSYKMLLYMACGVPVVVSPVGMNREVLGYGEVGLAAQDEEGWVDALSTVLGDSPRAGRMGADGRRVVEERFALPALAGRLAGYLRTFAR